VSTNLETSNNWFILFKEFVGFFVLSSMLVEHVSYQYAHLVHLNSINLLLIIK